MIYANVYTRHYLSSYRNLNGGLLDSSNVTTLGLVSLPRCRHSDVPWLPGNTLQYAETGAANASGNQCTLKKFELGDQTLHIILANFLDVCSYFNI